MTGAKKESILKGDLAQSRYQGRLLWGSEVWAETYFYGQEALRKVGRDGWLWKVSRKRDSVHKVRGAKWLAQV